MMSAHYLQKMISFKGRHFLLLYCVVDDHVHDRQCCYQDYRSNPQGLLLLGLVFDPSLYLQPLLLLLPFPLLLHPQSLFLLSLPYLLFLLLLPANHTLLLPFLLHLQFADPVLLTVELDELYGLSLLVFQTAIEAESLAKSLQPLGDRLVAFDASFMQRGIAFLILRVKEKLFLNRSEDGICLQLLKYRHNVIPFILLDSQDKASIIFVILHKVLHPWVLYQEVEVLILS